MFILNVALKPKKTRGRKSKEPELAPGWWVEERRTEKCRHASSHAHPLFTRHKPVALPRHKPAVLPQVTSPFFVIDQSGATM